MITCPVCGNEHTTRKDYVLLRQFNYELVCYNCVNWYQDFVKRIKRLKEHHIRWQLFQ